MGIETGIEWCDHTFNPWWGCQRVSPGCENCYAEAFAKRTGHRVWGPEAGVPRRFFGDKHWSEPVKWNAAARADGVRRRVFCASMADVGEDRADLDAQRVRLMVLVQTTPDLDWLFLTKRPQNLVRLLPWGADGWPSRVWAGTTIEDRARLTRVDELRRVPAAVRFLSIEPLLEDLGTINLDGIHWVIIGGESGPGARVFDMRWARSIIEQCRAARVAVFFKQAGRNPLVAGGAGTPPAKTDMLVRGLAQRLVYRLRDAKGGDLAELPPDLAVREFPGGAA